MYKVFFKDKVIFFDEPETSTERDHVMFGSGADDAKICDVTEKFLQDGESGQLVFYGDPEVLFGKFISLFQVIRASGGLVKNARNRYLFIYKRGRWDLPKGKTEREEEIRETALREVTEECGVGELQLRGYIRDTYHMYFKDNRLVIKRTSWYRMFHPGEEQPSPQRKEDIEKAVWAGQEDIGRILKNTYPSIVEVLREEGVITG